MKADVLLQAEHLHVSYDDGASYALQDLSLKIKRGAENRHDGGQWQREIHFFPLLCGDLPAPNGDAALEWPPGSL